MLLIPGALIGADRAAPLPRRPPRRHARRRGRRRPPAGSAPRRRRAERRARPRRRPRRARRARRRWRTTSTPGRSAREFKRYKEDVKKRGKPFFPYAMFHDTVMSLVVVVVIIGLAVHLVLHVAATTGDERRAGSGRSTPTRPTRARRASSRGRTGTSTSSSTCCGSSSGRSRSILGTVGIPTIAASSCCSRCRSSTGAASGGCSRRPVAIVARDPRRRLDGRPHVQGRDREGGARRREVVAGRAELGASNRASPDNAEAIAGAELFAQVGLPATATRTSARARSNLGAPDLTDDRRAGAQGVEYFQRYVCDPREFGNTVMPMSGFAASRRAAARSSRRSSRRRRAAAASRGRAVRVFLGITGASGAPYAARLLAGARRRRTARSASARRAPAIEVLATELYGDPRARRATRCSRASSSGAATASTVYDADDWQLAVRERLGAGRRVRDLPVLDGDARDDRRRRDGEPDPPRRLGRAQGGAQARPRAARDAALDRSTSRTCCTLRQAGATILFAAPGFYHGAETIDDLVDFVVARCLDQLGLENALVQRWGQMTRRDRHARRRRACARCSTASRRSTTR